MATGLQVFNANGKLIFSSAVKYFKKLGTFDITSAVAGSITNDAIRGKTIYIIPINVTLVSDGLSTAFAFPTHIRVNDNKISWDFAEFKPNVRHPPSYAKFQITYEYGYV